MSSDAPSIATWADFENYELKTTRIDMRPEFNQVVLLREFTGEQRDAFEDMVTRSIEKKSRKLMVATLISWAWVNEQGEQVQIDPKAINKMPARWIQKVGPKILDLCGLSNADIDQLAKNSNSDPSDSSGSS